MRWDELFEDLEGQLRVAQVRELEAEVADRVRRERATIGLQERFVAHRGRVVCVHVAADMRVEGIVRDVGSDWLLIDQQGRPHLVPYASVRAVRDLDRAAAPVSAVARRLSLGSALRAISRDRALVDLVDCDGRVLTGSIDAVGLDLLDLASHPADLPRRRENVAQRLAIPFGAIGLVRRH